MTLAYLYGSYASGRARSDSDLDIAILFRERASRRERAQLALKFADHLRRLAGREVDVREINDAPIEFKMQAIRPRHCLVAVSENERIRFEAEVISAYLDLKPALDLYYAYMTAQLREGQIVYGTRFRNRLLVPDAHWRTN